MRPAVRQERRQKRHQQARSRRTQYVNQAWYVHLLDIMRTLGEEYSATDAYAWQVTIASAEKSNAMAAGPASDVQRSP